MAGNIKEDRIARVHRLKERIELLVERVLVFDVGDNLDVLLVESDFFQIPGEILRIVDRAPELLDVAVFIVLIADQERAARLRLGLRGQQPEREDQAREEDGKGSYSHGKLPARQCAPHTN